MDLFPDLGEPGILDELFWFGPIIFQLILGVFFFWITGKWIKKASKSTRVVATFVMMIVTNIFLFIALIAVLKAVLHDYDNGEGLQNEVIHRTD